MKYEVKNYDETHLESMTKKNIQNVELWNDVKENGKRS